MLSAEKKVCSLLQLLSTLSSAPLFTDINEVGNWLVLVFKVKLDWKEVRHDTMAKIITLENNTAGGLAGSHRRRCIASFKIVQKFNFVFPRKLPIFLGEKLVKMFWFWTF